MPFDSESQTASLLSIRNFSRKNLYLRVFLYFLIAYIFIDLMVGLMAFLQGQDFQLLFSPASFFAIFNFYPTPGNIMRDYETLYGFLAGFLFVALFIVGYLYNKLIDTMALIFPPSKRREKSYPYQVIVTNSGIDIQFNEHRTARMEKLVWKQDIFAVFLKMESNYQLRLCLVQDPNYHKTITEYDEEYYRFSRKEIRQVKLGRMFISRRDRKRALLFLSKYFHQNYPEQYIDEAYFGR